MGINKNKKQSHNLKMIFPQEIMKCIQVRGNNTGDSLFIRRIVEYYYYYYTICMSSVTGISSWYFS